MKSFASYDPYREKILQEFRIHEDHEIDTLLEILNGAYLEQRNQDVSVRCDWLRSLAKGVRNDLSRHAEQISREMGKPIKESRAELEKCAWLCDHYAEQGQVYLESGIVQTDASYSAVHYESLGVILGVMPWNYPYWQAFRFFVPAILAGNACLLKHASNVSGCALMIEKLLRASDIPDDLFHVALIPGSETSKWIGDDRVKGVSLTGSEAAGSAVAEMAGKMIKPSLLELGGSNAMIILADADLDLAVDLAMAGRYQNNGQSCIAAKRFLVNESIRNEFVQKLTDRVQALVCGDPLNEETQIGVLARADLAETLELQMKQSVAMGAKIIYGGNRKAAFFEPTILDNVKPGMPAFEEETFGPLATVVSFNDWEEAVGLSNRSRFGLGVSIITNDV